MQYEVVNDNVEWDKVQKKSFLLRSQSLQHEQFFARATRKIYRKCNMSQFFTGHVINYVMTQASDEKGTQFLLFYLLKNVLKKQQNSMFE